MTDLIVLEVQIALIIDQSADGSLSLGGPKIIMEVVATNTVAT